MLISKLNLTFTKNKGCGCSGTVISNISNSKSRKPISRKPISRKTKSRKTKTRKQKYIDN